MTTVYDVFDNFLGEASCAAAERLSDAQWTELVEHLRVFYQSWLPLTPHSGVIFPGSWLAHHFHESHGRTLIGNDLLLFERVIVHDPIEPFVSTASRWTAPPGAPEWNEERLVLALVDIPSQRSGLQAGPPITAHYPPHVRAFMSVGEAYRFNYASRSSPIVRRALAALDEWRELVRMGAVELVPAMEITSRSTSFIARSAEAAIGRVQNSLDGHGGQELVSFDIRGGWVTPNWASEASNQRMRARHVSWVYAREIALADSGASLSAAELPVDQAILSSILPGRIAFPTPQVGAATSISVPGFSDIPLQAVAEIRRDEAAFAATRSILADILARAPAELAELQPSKRASFLATHLGAEVGLLRNSVRRATDRRRGNFVADLIKIGISAAVGGATGGEVAAAGAAIVGAAGSAVDMLRRGSEPSQRAATWIARNIGLPASNS